MTDVILFRLIVAPSLASNHVLRISSVAMFPNFFRLTFALVVVAAVDEEVYWTDRSGIQKVRPVNTNACRATVGVYIPRMKFQEAVE